tara:strand:+ start:129 stop:398 length:270 start_codon:yes stop_codon:yes gene_type:complete
VNNTNLELIKLYKAIGREETIKHLLKLQKDAYDKVTPKEFTVVGHSIPTNLDTFRVLALVVQEVIEWTERQEKLDNKVDSLLTEEAVND